MNLLHEVERVGLCGTDAVVVFHKQLAKAVGGLTRHAGLCVADGGDKRQQNEYNLGKNRTAPCLRCIILAFINGVIQM